MNPILKKLSNPHISRSEIADLLEKHIGTNPSMHHCQEAVQAIQRIRDEHTGEVAKVLVSLLPQPDEDPCKTVDIVIGMLRNG